MWTTRHGTPAKLWPQLTHKVELVGCRRSGQGHHAGAGAQLFELRALHGKLPCKMNCRCVLFCLGRTTFTSRPALCNQPYHCAAAAAMWHAAPQTCPCANGTDNRSHVSQHCIGTLQANYQLVLPTMQDYLQHVGAAASLAGYMIGSADIATIPGTVGECRCCCCGCVPRGPWEAP